MAKKKTKTKKVIDTSLDSKDEKILATIQKEFGKESITMINDAIAREPMKAIPTGSIMLDIALGIGGVPEGRIVEIFGMESSGKTTITLHIAAEAQKMGKKVAFVDAEHALDSNYASNIGVNIPKMFISQPDSGEDALNIVERLLDTGEIGLIVVDSVAALTPKVEIEGDIGDSHVGIQARMMSQALRKLTPKAKKANCTVVFINQMRLKIGQAYGDPRVTSGGEALKFYSSVRMYVHGSKEKKGTEITNLVVNAEVKKNKVAPPFQKAQIPVGFGVGIDLVKEAFAIASDKSFELIEQVGQTFYYRGDTPIKFKQRDDEGNLVKGDDGKQIEMILMNDQQEVEDENGKKSLQPIELKDNEVCKMAVYTANAQKFVKNHPEVFDSLREQIFKMMRG